MAMLRNTFVQVGAITLLAIFVSVNLSWAGGQVPGEGTPADPIPDNPRTFTTPKPEQQHYPRTQSPLADSTYCPSPTGYDSTDRTLLYHTDPPEEQHYPTTLPPSGKPNSDKPKDVLVPNPIKISLTVINENKVIPLTVDGSDSIWELKEIIEKIAWIPKDQQRLYLNQSLLHDNKQTTLMNYFGPLESAGAAAFIYLIKRG